MNEQALVRSLAAHIDATLEADIAAGRVPASVRSWQDVPENQEYGLDHPAWTTAPDGDTFQSRQKAAMDLVADQRGWNRPPKKSSCGCYAGLMVPSAVPKAKGGLRVDHAALRMALGGHPEIVEAMEAKAKGRPGVNASVLWGYFTKSVYQSGDLPVLATREAAQNGIDAIRAAIRAHKTRAGEGRFSVTWDERASALTWEDNGIGMDAQTVLGKFLVIGETGKGSVSGSEEAAGGFGVAKAVILGCSNTFRWMMDTRDNHVVADGADKDVEIFESPTFLQGVRLTIRDVPDEFRSVWDRARQSYVPIENRIRELLAANDFPEITLVFNGEEVRPMFSRRAGSKVAVDGSWGQGTTATVKAFRRPPGDRQGAYYVRLNGLFQFKTPAQRGNLKADIVVDLSTSIRPGSPGYPLNAARDALQEPARWTFEDIVELVEKENESVGRSDEDEVFEPESDDADLRQGASEIADLTAEAFADEGFRKVLAEAAGGIADFYGEMAKYAAKETPTASLAPAGTKAPDPDDTPQRPMILPPGMKIAVTATPVEPDVTAPSEAGPGIAVRQLRTALETADDVVKAGGGGGRLTVVTSEVRSALDKAEAGEDLEPGEVTTIVHAVERAADSALGVGGGGLLQAASITGQASVVLEPMDPAAAQRVRRNPFGKLAGLRISRKNYDRSRAYRFKKGYGRWIPHLTAWDATLRLVASEARIRRRFKPGFILDDELMGLATTTPTGGLVIYLHPDRLAQVVKAHRDRPIAIAAFLHGIAVHELTHADGRMGEGHSEAFVAAREDLGAATAHLLPAIAMLATRVFGLPEKPSEEGKRAVKLEKDLEKARTTIKVQKSKLGEVTHSADLLRGRLSALGHIEAPTLGTTVKTPGSRITWSDLRGWLDGWHDIYRRRTSAKRYELLDAHLGLLTEALVEAGPPADLDELERVLVDGHNVLPPRGQRADHLTTRLRDAIDRTRHRARSPAERLLDAAASALRTRPPAGVDLVYLDSFLARNRPALLGVIRSKLGAA